MREIYLQQDIFVDLAHYALCGSKISCYEGGWIGDEDVG